MTHIPERDEGKRFRLERGRPKGQTDVIVGYHDTFDSAIKAGEGVVEEPDACRVIILDRTTQRESVPEITTRCTDCGKCDPSSHPLKTGKAVLRTA